MGVFRPTIVPVTTTGVSFNMFFFCSIIVDYEARYNNYTVYIYILNTRHGMMEKYKSGDLYMLILIVIV